MASIRIQRTFVTSSETWYTPSVKMQSTPTNSIKDQKLKAEGVVTFGTEKRLDGKLGTDYAY